jgi:hypothetical protein
MGRLNSLVSGAGVIRHLPVHTEVTIPPEACVLRDGREYRKIMERCLAAGVDRTLLEAWIEVGRQWAGTAATLIHETRVRAE